VTDVVFPVLSQDKQDATGLLSTWYVTEGQQVAAEALLAEVQMDKVDAEVVAPVAGVVHLLVAEESEVSQGTVIARID
jgi:pyruvate/2-oxoglutarate dehydrogenase complex dihydrolipoamide acyltransferase (E2) component